MARATDDELRGGPLPMRPLIFNRVIIRCQKAFIKEAIFIHVDSSLLFILRNHAENGRVAKGESG
jgi:hypothetical protein